MTIIAPESHEIRWSMFLCFYFDVNESSNVSGEIVSAFETETCFRIDESRRLLDIVKYNFHSRKREKLFVTPSVVNDSLMNIDWLIVVD